MIRPSRRSRILRIDPDGLGPPALTIAESSVDWLDSVTTPGRCAGPTMNTRSPRSWPSETERSKLVNRRPICARRFRSRSAALTPATLKLPTFGRLSMPLRSTVLR